MATIQRQILFSYAFYQVCAGTFTDIVLFGDSLSDDCTHGASSIVDGILHTDQVSAFFDYFFPRSSLQASQDWPAQL